jgi:16S rRNA (uracil1498-N3)-methyltransferase
VCVRVPQVESTPPIRPAVRVAFAVPKGKRLDWLLEKATELGAASLQPISFERSVAGGKPLSDAKRERWLGHCIAAAKQSGLNHLPQVNDIRRLDDLLMENDGLTLLGDLDRSARPLRDVLTGTVDSMTLIVGPEGGLNDAERAAAISAGAIPVCLGQTTLRIETAVLALLAGVRTMV